MLSFRTILAALPLTLKAVARRTLRQASQGVIIHPQAYYLTFEVDGQHFPLSLAPITYWKEARKKAKKLHCSFVRGYTLMRHHQQEVAHVQ